VISPRLLLRPRWACACPPAACCTVSSVTMLAPPVFNTTPERT
jgi:hypothetical protein